MNGSTSALVLVSRHCNLQAAEAILESMWSKRPVPSMLLPAGGQGKEVEDVLMRCVPRAGCFLYEAIGLSDSKQVVELFCHILMTQRVVVVGSLRSASLIVYALQLLMYPLEREFCFLLPNESDVARSIQNNHVVGVVSQLWYGGQERIAKLWQDKEDPIFVYDMDKRSLTRFPAASNADTLPKVAKNQLTAHLASLVKKAPMTQSMNREIQR